MLIYRVFAKRSKNGSNTPFIGLKQILEFIIVRFLFPYTKVEHNTIQFFKKL